MTAFEQKELRCHWVVTTRTLILFSSYTPQQSLIVVCYWMSQNPKSLCYIFNSLFHLILITYGVYLPAYFIARRALFSPFYVQLYYFPASYSVLLIS